MAAFETGRGTRVFLQLPSTEWPELQKAKEAYEERRAKQRAAQQRLGSLRGKREKAIHADRVALAEAIKDGKDDPGDKAVEKIDKEMLEVNRLLEALDIALDDGELDIINVVDEHRDDWHGEANEKLDSAYEKYAEAVETLASAADAVFEAWALFRWTKNFPESNIYRARPGYVLGLEAPHGDPYAFHQVIDALRQDATRSAPTPDTDTGTGWFPSRIAG